MITDIAVEKLVAFGEPLRASYLVEQAGYTLGIAAEDGAPLAALLPDGYLAEVQAEAAAVRAAAAERAMADDEVKAATRAQNQALRDAKVWRRAVVQRGRRMQRLGRTVPEVLTRIPRVSGVPEMARQINEMIAALAANLEVMGGSAAAPLLENGRRLAGLLGSADAEQERKRLAALPEKVREFYASKGRLYIGLKVINDAGHELHADNPAAAARYNLRILHRRPGSKPATPAAPAPATP